jgi:membrane protease YdiL (CAAX protease family)
MVMGANLPADVGVAVPRRSRRRDLFEMIGTYALILAVIWTPRPWQWWLWMVAATAVIVISALSFDGWKRMGLTAENLWRSLWVVAAVLAVAAAAVVVAAQLNTLRTPETPQLFVRRYGMYAIWAMVQQFLLQCFFLARSVRLLRNTTKAAGLAAGLFAAAHLPNPILTVITLLFGVASCLLFLRYRNLWPLAAAHAILGIAIAITVPGHVDHNMRVGYSYLTYTQRNAHRHPGSLAQPQ